ncbi:thiamine-phosphate kinase [Corynebacterium halotolerans]|uniref:thiamine-phosphate kinase n=1 Tax=Corynebacterium halotolerans TaxID=225326 RepID=UPI003CF646F8
MSTSAGPTIGEVGEHAAIAEILAVAPSTRNGDDAAVLSHATPNSRAVATVDMLIEGRHFNLEWSSPEEVGHKAIVQNFADIQAMGARPVAALLAISAPPHTPLDVLRGLARGVAGRLDQFSAELVGGDLTAGDKLVVSVTAIGSLGGSLPELTLNRAKVGQRVVVSGRIGDSAAGLALLQRYGRDVPAEFTELVAAHRTPHLAPGRGMIARATGATAMTDNSDGLIVDLTTMAKRSGVNIDLHRDAIAPHHLMVKAGELLGIDPWEWVLTGGEDHTLMATTAEDVPSGFRPIGRVLRGSGVTIDGTPPEYGTGWVSF